MHTVLSFATSVLLSRVSYFTAGLLSGIEVARLIWPQVEPLPPVIVYAQPESPNASTLAEGVCSTCGKTVTDFSYPATGGIVCATCLVHN